MKFNINDSVMVKLTPFGKALLKIEHQNVFDGLKRYQPYIPPKEDENGYSTWQLWVLMQTFGPHIFNGSQLPFETDIEL